MGIMKEKYSEDEILEEIRKEWLRDDPVAQRCRLVSFSSHSNGRGRRKRRIREVCLLVVDKRFSFQVKDNEIKPRKRKNHSQPDQLAMEILSDMPEDERTMDNLLKRVMAIAALGIRQV
jgi:hypothetical protein